LFNKLKDHKLTIFSGDIDKCVFGDQLATMDFKTRIFFTYTDKIKIENKINLPKYSGYIISSNYEGDIKIEK